MKPEHRERLDAAAGLLEMARDSAQNRLNAYEGEKPDWEYFRVMSDDEVLARMRGSAMVDDPPPEWSRAQLAAFLRGYLYAEYKFARAERHCYIRPIRAIRQVLQEQS